MHEVTSVQLIVMMGFMNVVDLKRVDLNLLVVFQALMQEGSVTRAAVKLGLSQSAASAALSRLRILLDDPLFERSKAGMVPTSKALEISARVSPSLNAIAGVLLHEPEFDPKTSNRTIHLAMSDDVELVLAPWLARQKHVNGWGLDFAIHQTNSTLWRESVANARNDLTLTALTGQDDATVKVEPLFSGSYACVFDSEQLPLSDPITFNEYVSYEHVRVSYDVQRGWVDDALAVKGYKRETLCSISHFSGLPSLIMSVPVIATIPDHAARAIASRTGLAVGASPVKPPQFTISMVWHARGDGSPLNVWIRQLLQEFAQEL
ncbi:MAG: LysR family transcriptional regulator [Gulosibacter sp.]|uniref:LysR family transcriptional regulator n=1 Tax=Gulosibacter sp. TaxID=2817531 RepID=UPI003F8E4A13